MKTNIIDYQGMMDSLAIYHVVQPIVDIKTDNIIGYEFLLRSNHPSFKNPELLFDQAMKNIIETSYGLH